MPRDYEAPTINASTPGAIFVPGEQRGRGSTAGYWRMPTAEESAAASLKKQMDALPQNIKDAIASGQLLPEYSTVKTGGGRTGEAVVNSGITGFTSAGPDDTYYTYDLAGNKTGQQQVQRGGGFLGGILDKIGSGVGDFLFDPAKATTKFFENPGVKEAAIIAAIANGVDPTIFGGAGSAAAGAGTLGAAEGALTAAEIASLPGAATGAGLASIGAAAPEILTAGSAPGAIASTLPSYLAAPEILTGAGLASIEATAPEILTAGSAPGSALAATTSGEAGLASLMGPQLPTGLSPAAGFSPTLTADTVGSLVAPEAASGIATLPEAIPSLAEMVASGTAPGSAGAAGAVSGALTGADLAAAQGLVTAGATPALVSAAEQGAQNYINSGGSSIGGQSGVSGTDVLSQADKIASGTTSGGTLNTALGNEAVASGMSPGSLGAEAATQGVLTPTQLTAATGSAGLGSLTGADTLATNLASSANEAVASGLSPGSVGATEAAAGTLTPAQLGAASGVVTSGSGIPDLSKVKDLLPASDKSSGFSGANGLGMLGLAALLASMNKGSGTDNSYKGTIPEYTMSRTKNEMPKNYRPGQGGVDYFSPTTYTKKAADGGLMSLSDNVEGSNFELSGSDDHYPSMVGSGYPVASNYPSRVGEVEQNGIVQQSMPQFSGLGSLYQSSNPPQSFNMAQGGAVPGQYNLGSYSDGGRLLKGPGDGVSDSIPAIIGQKQPARLATGEFVIPARIVSELGNGSTDAGAQRLYDMMKRVQQKRLKTKNVAANTNAAKYLPA